MVSIFTLGVMGATKRREDVVSQGRRGEGVAVRNTLKVEGEKGDRTNYHREIEKVGLLVLAKGTERGLWLRRSWVNRRRERFGGETKRD